jgi:hypothetical protein
LGLLDEAIVDSKVCGHFTTHKFTHVDV